VNVAFGKARMIIEFENKTFVSNLLRHNPHVYSLWLPEAL